MKSLGWARLFRSGVCTAIALAMIACVVNAQSGGAISGRLNEDQLGQTLAGMGLKPEKVEKRYDFAFKAVYKGEEWKLSMSTVLSQNQETVWVMAWLDQIPSSAGDVPRMSLLRLLAANDRLGNGKFFAYIPTNKRFVLQRVVPNEGLSTAVLRDVLKDLGTTVVEEYPIWSVSGWKQATGNIAAGQQSAGAPTRTSAKDPKFGERRVR